MAENRHVRVSSLRATALSFTPSKTPLPAPIVTPQPAQASPTYTTATPPLMNEYPRHKYSPGDVVWLLNQIPGATQVFRKDAKSGKTEPLGPKGHGHPLVILKCWPFSGATGEELKYQTALLTTAGSMAPADWYQCRSIRNDLKKSLPVDHPRSGISWSPIHFGNLELPPLYLTPESKPLSKDKPSFVKFDATIWVQEVQLRKYHFTFSENMQPRLDRGSYQVIFKLLCPGEDASRLYEGSRDGSQSQLSQYQQPSPPPPPPPPPQVRAPLAFMDTIQANRRSS